jgi:hypothetical protein
VGDQQGQELDWGKELVVDSQAWVNLGALVVDQAVVITVGKPPEAHGSYIPHICPVS